MPPLLLLQDIQLTIGTTRLLDGAELSLQEGEHLALVGRNGSGKSTLLKIAASLTEADGGSRLRLLGRVSVLVGSNPAPSALRSTKPRGKLSTAQRAVRSPNQKQEKSP